ncbi:hypothetical protein [Candidatus Entotheonella palauensis]|nr:hypothetical protein [Candidatus Entotheonella palauensis]
MPSPDPLTPQRMFGMTKPFISEMAPPPDLSGPAWWFIFCGNRLLLEERDGELHVPCLDHLDDLGVATGSQHYLGRPPIPGHISIARRLIDLYVDKHGQRQ